MYVLVSGDQLMAERAQNTRKNLTHSVGRLEGVITVSKDWHTKFCFLQVVFTWCYCERLYYVCNIFRWYGNVCLGREIRILSWGRFHNYKQNKCPNWTNKQYQCSRGIFTGIHSCYTLKSTVQVVLQSYIIAAALKTFKMQSINDNLPPSILCDLMQAPGALCWNKSN